MRCCILTCCTSFDASKYITLKYRGTWKGSKFTWINMVYIYMYERD